MAPNSCGDDRNGVRVALTIAGSDSGGGAGIQADLKTFSALGVYGATVVTALTAQNTLGVKAIHAVDPDFVRRQMDAVFGDLRVDAVKIGMLGSAEVVAVVADSLRAWHPPYIVLDPVMVAKGGDRLLRSDAIAALVERLLPLADLITPNLPEAGELLGHAAPADRPAMLAAAAALRSLGPKNVLLKGGHLDTDSSPDLLVTAGGTIWFDAPRIATRHTHGTGCTLSAAIAAFLALGHSLPDAVGEAKAWLTEALRSADSLRLGGGIGPVHHFHALWPVPDATLRHG